MTVPIRKFGVLVRPFYHPPRSRPQIPVKPEPIEDGGDWKTHISPDDRRRIVNHIMDTLTRRIPGCSPEQLHRLWKLAERFEEKTYSEATSKYDYLRKLSVRLLAVEGKAKTNSLPSNSPAHRKESSDDKKFSVDKKFSDDKKSFDGNKSSDVKKFSAIKEPLRSRL